MTVGIASTVFSSFFNIFGLKLMSSVQYLPPAPPPEKKDKKKGDNLTHTPTQEEAKVHAWLVWLPYVYLIQVISSSLNVPTSPFEMQHSTAVSHLSAQHLQGFGSIKCSTSSTAKGNLLFFSLFLQRKQKCKLQSPKNTIFNRVIIHLQLFFSLINEGEVIRTQEDWVDKYY